ncbi:hypothetical protein T4B_11366 [Trichinella pseudospiralis]|uniref:Uncharacterized protein n=1 Tax=Trichinella pseudospiralis TaxID=6337 RepID=A0A0V1IT68_TRIPS|nr:hypothetical protein T4B_11366 [Trichinella pseudospiralis]KRZ25904.1 hypothetical protein T4B_11366 [Trichinella pseudospiralis]
MCLPHCSWSVLAWLQCGSSSVELLGFAVAVNQQQQQGSFAKTSSLFLFIGIGTYVAYQIWFKLHTVGLIETFCCSLRKHLSNVIEKHTDDANTTSDQSTVAEISEEQATIVKLFSRRSSVSSGINKNGDVVQQGSESSAVQLCKIDDNSLPAPRPSRCSGGGCAVTACLLSSPNTSRTGRSESCNSSSSLINGSVSRQSCQYIWDDEFDQCSPAKRGKSSTCISPRQGGGGMVVVRPADEACISDNSSDVSHLFSRDPSEWSEVVALKAIGQCTLAELDKLHEHVSALRNDVESLDFDCTQYAENRQNVEMDLRHMYCSVTLATESESTSAQLDDAYSRGGSSCQKSASSLAQSEPTVLACCPKCGTCLTTPEQAADSQLMTDSLQTMISADMTSTSVSSTRALLLDSCFFSSLEESGLSPHPQRSESEPEDDHSVSASALQPSSEQHSPPTESHTGHVGHYRIVSYFNNVLLLDLRSFLSQHHVVSRTVLDYIVNELIQVRQVHNVLVPYGRSMNIIQACLYHTCIFQTAAVGGAVAKSIQNFQAWFANCCSEQQRVCSASLQCLGALQNWLNLIGKYEYRNHINQFESNLAEFELAVKILVAWEVLLYHSSVILIEEADHSLRSQQQFDTLDDSEATNIFANLLEKPVEDFSDTEIAVLTRLFSITLEIFKSYASDQSEIWTTHPQQVTTTTAAAAVNRLLVLSVVPSTFYPVNMNGTLKKQKLFEALFPIASVDSNSFTEKLFLNFSVHVSRDLVFIFMIGHFVLAKPTPLNRSTTKCQLKSEDGNFSTADGSQLYNCCCLPDKKEKMTTVVQVSMIGALFSRLPLAYTFIHLADSDHLQKMRSSIALADFLLPSRV